MSALRPTIRYVEPKTGKSRRGQSCSGPRAVREPADRCDQRVAGSSRVRLRRAQRIGHLPRLEEVIGMTGRTASAGPRHLSRDAGSAQLTIRIDALKNTIHAMPQKSRHPVGGADPRSFRRGDRPDVRPDIGTIGHTAPIAPHWMVTSYSEPPGSRTLSMGAGGSCTDALSQVTSRCGRRPYAHENEHVRRSGPRCAAKLSC